MKKYSVYTRNGDHGTTSLVGGVRIKKTDDRLEAYGSVDELSAQLGLLATYLIDGDELALVERIQNDLFVVCSYLATDQSKTELYPSCRLSKDETDLVERAIDRIEAILPEQRCFILPGGTRAAAVAHVCRTVCRRAERRILSLGENVEIAPEILSFMNRISDYLYVLSRKLNFIAGREEKTWQKTCK
jgi:cob(I)alamin adenosyltransferase